MKKLFYLVAVATLFTLSCEKEIVDSGSHAVEGYTVKASVEPCTKATINAAHTLVWAAGDQIGLFDTEKHSFTLSGGAGTTDGEFTLDEGTFDVAAAASAFFPWTNNSAVDGLVTFNLPAEYWGYTSGKMLTPLVASLSGSTDHIAFKHAGAAVKVTINNLPAHTHSIGMSVAYNQITGNYNINPANAGTDVITLADAPNLSKNTVTLYVYNGSKSKWDFIFPVPELTKPKLSFSITDENGINVWSKNLKAQSYDLCRGDILVMPSLDITPYSQFSESADWTFCGKINGYTATDIPMYTDGTVCILKGVTFKAGDTIKVRKDKKDDEYYTGDSVASDGTKDVWFTISSKTIELKDAKCDYPAPKATLYFGINGSIPKSIHISSSALAPGAEWPGLELTEREYINGKWYYKHEVDGTTIWGKSLTGVYIVSKDSWNTSSSTISFSSVKTEYYFEATASTVIEQLDDRPEEVPVEHTEITIDGDLSEWEDVDGTTVGNHTVKVESDEDNIYFYSFRSSTGTGSSDYSAIWAGGGYLYLSLDLDNDPSTGDGNIYGNKAEFIVLTYPYAGSSETPAIAESMGGDWTCSPSPYTIANLEFAGAVDGTGVALEFSIPLDDIPTLPDAPITVKLWGNKGMSAVSLTHVF